MAEPPRQLTLDLPHAPSHDAEDFLISASNEEAFAAIERWPDWPEPLLHLRGPRGSGKTHLGTIWAGWSGAVSLDARQVIAAHVPKLSAAPALVLEDLDQGPFEEEALFHLVNIARERGAPILFTSIRPIEGCGIGTADLLSRLRRATSAVLGPPDDALLRAVLVKLFVDRQLVVDTMLIDYIATRIERSLARAGEFVAEIDLETLSRGRRVTRAIVAELISSADGAGGE